MKKVLLLLLIFCNQAFAQDLPAEKVKRDRRFEGQALYGFMNGGSDLFYEYGFKDLRVIDLIYAGEEYTVEIYTMNTSLNAFGIYSLHTFKCLQADSLRCFTCLTKYQLSAATGNKCVFVTCTSGTSAAKDAEELLKKYVDLHEEKIAVPKQFDSVKPPYSGNLKYARGELGAFKISIDLASMLEGVKNYELWFAAQQDAPDLCLILFNNADDCKRLKSKFAHEQVLEEGENLLFVKLTDSEL